MSVDLRAMPFYLNDQKIDWVEKTYAAMSEDEKIGQLFSSCIDPRNPQEAEELLKLHFGGYMIRPFPVKGLREAIAATQRESKIPLLISGNLESGGSGVVEEGTTLQMPMGCTATGNPESGYQLGKISAQEATSIGLNWGYAPIVDIDLNYRNPITNIRAFSSHKEQVLEMARGYLKAAKEEGLAATIKHFPGDGSDERDQHLLVSVNQLSADDWFSSYGMIYQTLINEGAPTVMVGHIAQPAVAKAVNPDISDAEAYYPSSISKTMVTGILRERFGFNGLLVTDSTLMVGYMQKLPRRKALAASIEAGIDVILFNRNKEEDFRYMKEAYEEGLLSDERLHDAVIRQLALKASLNLDQLDASGIEFPDKDPEVIVGQPLFRQWAKEAGKAAPTLVKCKEGMLPLSPEKTRRIYLNVIENSVDDQSAFAQEMKARFEKEDFTVELRKRELKVNMQKMMAGEMDEDSMRVLAEIGATTDSFVSKYDMAVIVLNMPTVSNATVVRVNWSVFAGLGNDIPWYSGEMPLVVVSFANPYHLLDIPMADVYVNAYADTGATKDAVFEKLMGRDEFTGVSPVDAFCGHGDCRY